MTAAPCDMAATWKGICDMQGRLAVALLGMGWLASCAGGLPECKDSGVHLLGGYTYAPTVTIERNGCWFYPGPDTVIQPGDVVRFAPERYF